MEPFATVDDVTEVWGELSSAEEDKVEAWSKQVSTKLRLRGRRYGIDIDAVIAADELKQHAARDAVVNAIRRVLMNPEGYRQRATTTGPFTESGTIDTALSTGLLYLADDDLDDLFPTKRKRIRSFHLRSGLL